MSKGMTITDFEDTRSKIIQRYDSNPDYMKESASKVLESQINKFGKVKLKKNKLMVKNKQVILPQESTLNMSHLLNSIEYSTNKYSQPFLNSKFSDFITLKSYVITNMPKQK